MVTWSGRIPRKAPQNISTQEDGKVLLGGQVQENFQRPASNEGAFGQNSCRTYIPTMLGLEYLPISAFGTKNMVLIRESKMSTD